VNTLILTISRNDTIARETDVSKQLMIVDLAVSQSLLLIMAGAKKRFLTFGADKMLYMPSFAEGMDNSLLYGPPETVKSDTVDAFIFGACHRKRSLW
jgi:hypothetical protein